ncbi:MAG: DUF11 domain-containing protein, partial [Colwellia sp.]|nr:DUF11 domain-containing protein [Colwellia sp.]
AGSVCTLPLGSLPVGAAPRTATFAVRVDSPLAAGVTEIVNDAFVDDDGSGGPDLNPADNRATEATPIDGGVGGTGPDLVVTKSDGGIVAGAGDMVLYAVTVANVGNQHASGVELSETVPANASFVAAASAPGWACSGTSAGSACTLAVGSVAAGAAPQSFAFAVRIDDPLAAGVTEVANTVVATDDGSGGAEQNPGDNTAREITPLDVGVSTGPDLAVTKSDDGAVVSAGDVLVYALEVTNLGNQDATAVLLTENVPSHTTFAAAPSDAAWTCAGISAGSSCSLAVGDLAAGVTRSFAFAVRVDAPVGAGVTELVNSAAVAGAGVDLDPTNNTATEITPLDGGVGGTGPN